MDSVIHWIKSLPDEDYGRFSQHLVINIKRKYFIFKPAK